MNCQKRNLFLLVFSLFLSVTFAQSDFRPGYILLSPEDTVFGELDNKSYHENSQYINFRLSKNDEKKRYNPDDLFAYRFTGGKYYVSKRIKNGTTEQGLFMEYLINGVLDVYLFQDAKKKNRYYVSNDTLPLREIVYESGMTQKDGKRYFYEKKLYEGILRYYTLDSPEMQVEISKIDDPDRDKLIMFAKKYHDATCKDGDCIIYEKKAPRKIIFRTGFAVAQTVFLGHRVDGSVAGSYFFDYGVEALFQATQRGERTFIGVGIHNFRFLDDQELLRGGLYIPLSFNYFLSKDGFTPVGSYSLILIDLAIQKLDGGVKYQYKDVSMSLITGLWTGLFYKPMAWFGQVHLCINIR